MDAVTAAKEIKKACIMRKRKVIINKLNLEGDSSKREYKEPPKKGLEARMEFAKNESIYTELTDNSKYLDKDYNISEWFDEWLKTYKMNSVKSGTFESYVCVFNYYVEPLIGNLKLKKIKAEELQKFYNCLYDAGYSKSTLSLVKAVTGAMFKQAYLNGMIPSNISERASIPKMTSKETKKHALTKKEQEIILKEIKGHPIEPIVKTALTTGMRIGELIGLEWQDIDFKKNIINVRGTLKRSRNYIFYKDSPKTKSGNRTIPMLKSTKNILLRLKDIRNYQFKYEGFCPLKGFENFVFLREDGVPYDGQHIRQQLNHLVEYINYNYPDGYIEHITPHCFRHTFATRAIECGISPKVVQEILGHSSIKMTLDMYTHVLEEEKSEEIKRMEDTFLI